MSVTSDYLHIPRLLPSEHSNFLTRNDLTLELRRAGIGAVGCDGATTASVGGDLYPSATPVIDRAHADRRPLFGKWRGNFLSCNDSGFEGALGRPYTPEDAYFASRNKVQAWP